MNKVAELLHQIFQIDFNSIRHIVFQMSQTQTYGSKSKTKN